VVRWVVVVVACGMTGAVVSVVVVRVVVVVGSLPQPASAPIETVRARPTARARIEFTVVVILKPSLIDYSCISTVP